MTSSTRAKRLVLGRVLRALIWVIGLAWFGAPVVSMADVVAAEPERVSLVQLIATPERFDGHVVEVDGFCWLEFEGNALYLHREDWEHVLLQNAIWLAIPKDPRPRVEPSKASGHYVSAVGVFRASEHGHMGGFAGLLDSITVLEPSIFGDGRPSKVREDTRPVLVGLGISLLLFLATTYLVFRR